MRRKKVNPVLLTIIASLVAILLAVGFTAWWFIGHSSPNSVALDDSREIESETAVDPEPTELSDDAYGEALRYNELRKQEILTYPIAAEIEYRGVLHNVYKSGTTVFYYDTAQDSFAYGYNSVLADGDLWVYPNPAAPLDITESTPYFGCAWKRTDGALKGMLGWLGANATLELRARTASYMEWVYRYPNGKFCRMVVTDKYIVFSDLLFDFVFDIKTY